MFSDLQKTVASRFNLMQGTAVLYCVDANRDGIWECYLNAFPEAERQEHTCNCCKAFIRQVGNVVTIGTDNQVCTLWDLPPTYPEQYRPAVEALHAYVKGLPVSGLWHHDLDTAGTDKSFSEKHQVVFRHFCVQVPLTARNTGNRMVRRSGELNTSRKVLGRAVAEISMDALETVLELIAQGSLYRGPTYQKQLLELQGLKQEAKDVPDHLLENFLWRRTMELPESVTHIKNTSIGELLAEISKGTPLDAAVSMFEKMVAPSNYKRPTGLVTQSMVQKAREELEKLGMISALSRRRLDTRDLGPHNALFVQRSAAPQGDVFSDLAKPKPVEPQSLAKVEEVGIEKFLADILPTAKTIRVLVENRHLGNFVTLTGAVDPEAPGLFQWDSSFGWSYTGGVADSMREQVAALGGRVDGVLRFTHSWNHDGQNQSLMDLHVFIPGHKYKAKSLSQSKEVHDDYGTGPRVGWNHRQDLLTGGNQDVDHVTAPGKSVPVENITFPDIRKMPEGEYTFKVHNWNARNPNTSGFRAEIECGGNIHQYDYPKHLTRKEWVTVATAVLKNGEFTVTDKIPSGSSSRVKWNVPTCHWRNVKAITVSPNHWDKPVGNKHWMFLLEGCVSDEATRGFYNEFLCAKLSDHRKVMETLAGKVVVAAAEGAELSGLGFSETLRNHLFVEVEGKFRRQLKILF